MTKRAISHTFDGNGNHSPFCGCTRGIRPEPVTTAIIERVERVARKFEINSAGCWLWTGHMTEDGYGQWHRIGPTIRAHRFMYELIHGAIAPTMQLDHLCRVRHCVNPAHLEIVTNEENMARGKIMDYYRRGIATTPANPTPQEEERE